MEVILNESQNKHLKRNEMKWASTEVKKTVATIERLCCVLHSGCGLQSNRQNVHLIK